MSWFWSRWCKKELASESKVADKASNLAPLNKYYAFNETGNIMVCTTKEGEENINSPLKVAFTDMSLFFSAMTKAIVTSNDKDNQPRSIYDTDALTAILDKSELFIEIRDESITASSNAVGDLMSRQLTESLLGFTFNTRVLSFSKGLFQSIIDKKKRNIKAEQNNKDGVGSIFFICENLLGLPMVTAVVIQLVDNMAEGEKAGEKIGKRDMSEILDIPEKDCTYTIMRTWKFNKKTYSFISPSLLANCQVTDQNYNDQYIQLVEQLKQYLTNKPTS